MSRRLSGAEQLGRLMRVAPEPSDATAMHLDPLDFEEAAQAAMRWHMGAALMTTLRRQELDGRLGPETLERLEGARLATVMRNRVLRRRVLTVLRALAAEGMTPLALKGAAVLLATPEGTPCTRFMEDVDLLVAPDEHARAERVVAALGFVSFSEQSPGHHHGPKQRDPDTGTVVELHRRPLRIERPALTERLTATAETLWIAAGLAVRVPDRHHRLLHNLIHAQESNADFARGVADLRHLHEFAALWTGLDGDDARRRLIDDATRFGLGTQAMAWLFAAHHLFGTPVPTGLRFRRIERSQFERLRRRDRGSPATCAVRDAAMLHLLAVRRLLPAGTLRRRWRGWARAALGRGTAG